ncbi:hypothetical protein DPEC_G00248620 [Dallia pectoralis]|uniref:Uncharacterized protein n=1 Tax=Dallia pectoralis TaxID=75939 RepID=A0ACC2FWT2_DALPE|nr:hypothetical protein DPEC_G00248620 [Dallia pectoralis]
MVVECAFGILTARWRVLLSRLQISPDYVDTSDGFVHPAQLPHQPITKPEMAGRGRTNWRQVAYYKEHGRKQGQQGGLCSARENKHILQFSRREPVITS